MPRLPTSPSPATEPAEAIDDGPLVRRALAGDGEAVEAVLTRLSCIPRFVFRLNRTGAHRLPSDALEDGVQQVYTALWPRLRDYVGGASLESWAFGFCRNCLRAELRRRATRLRLLPPVPEEAADDAAADGDRRVAPPEEAAVRDERLGELREALEGLPPEERVVVELRHLEDWSFERIARELGIAASTVKDRGYRGMQRLQRALRADRPGVAG